ncbi:MAG: hypothetical protein CM15mP62_05630 [Rhodospirillaceae bacterium]|nr:MAG: hypothetical protein CM15mP62_05630 [Rhodospirillaceae bacterium]
MGLTTKKKTWDIKKLFIGVMPFEIGGEPNFWRAFWFTIGRIFSKAPPLETKKQTKIALAPPLLLKQEGICFFDINLKKHLAVWGPGYNPGKILKPPQLCG